MSAAASPPTVAAGLVIDDKLSEVATRQRFNEIADFLLNGVELYVDKTAYRFAEIEFYLNGGSHLDTFTHGSDIQQKRGLWYWHKHGNTYKGGTYKGLDISIGTSDKFMGGILIRAIEDKATKRVIEGPCKVCDHILTKTMHMEDGIAALVKDMGTIEIDNAKRLHVQVAPALEKRRVFQSPRVGLTYRKASGARFHMREYRYSTVPEQLGRYRIGFAVWLHRNGTDDDTILKLTGMKSHVLTPGLQAYTDGLATKHESWNAKIIAAPAQFAECYGAWAAAHDGAVKGVGAGPVSAPKPAAKRPTAAKKRTAAEADADAAASDAAASQGSDVANAAEGSNATAEAATAPAAAKAAPKAAPKAGAKAAAKATPKPAAKATKPPVKRSQPAAKKPRTH